jgi:hypothetical protein
VKAKLLTAAVVAVVLSELVFYGMISQQKHQLRGTWATLAEARESEQGATALVGHHDLDRNSTRGLFRLGAGRPGSPANRPRSFARAVDQAEALFPGRRVDRLRNAMRVWSTCENAEGGGSTLVAVDVDSGEGLYWTSSDSCLDGM